MSGSRTNPSDLNKNSPTRRQSVPGGPRGNAPPPSNKTMPGQYVECPNRGNSPPAPQGQIIPPGNRLPDKYLQYKKQSMSPGSPGPELTSSDIDDSAELIAKRRGAQSTPKEQYKNISPAFTVGSPIWNKKAPQSTPKDYRNVFPVFSAGSPILGPGLTPESKKPTQFSECKNRSTDQSGASRTQSSIWSSFNTLDWVSTNDGSSSINTGDLISPPASPQGRNVLRPSPVANSQQENYSPRTQTPQYSVCKNRQGSTQQSQPSPKKVELSQGIGPIGKTMSMPPYGLKDSFHNLSLPAKLSDSKFGLDISLNSTKPEIPCVCDSQMSQFSNVSGDLSGNMSGSFPRNKMDTFPVSIRDPFDPARPESPTRSPSPQKDQLYYPPQRTSLPTFRTPPRRPLNGSMPADFGPNTFRLNTPRSIRQMTLPAQYTPQKPLNWSLPPDYAADTFRQAGSGRTPSPRKSQKDTSARASSPRKGQQPLPSRTQNMSLPPSGAPPRQMINQSLPPDFAPGPLVPCVCDKTWERSAGDLSGVMSVSFPKAKGSQFLVPINDPFDSNRKSSPTRPKPKVLFPRELLTPSPKKSQQDTSRGSSPRKSQQQTAGMVSSPQKSPQRRPSASPPQEGSPQFMSNEYLDSIPPSGFSGFEDESSLPSGNPCVCDSQANAGTSAEAQGGSPQFMSKSYFDSIPPSGFTRYENASLPSGWPSPQPNRQQGSPPRSPQRQQSSQPQQGSPRQQSPQPQQGSPTRSPQRQQIATIEEESQPSSPQSGPCVCGDDSEQQTSQANMSQSQQGSPKRTPQTPQGSSSRSPQGRSPDWGSPLLGQGQTPQRIQYPGSPSKTQESQGAGGPCVCGQTSDAQDTSGEWGSPLQGQGGAPERIQYPSTPGSPEWGSPIGGQGQAPQRIQYPQSSKSTSSAPASQQAQGQIDQCICDQPSTTSPQPSQSNLSQQSPQRGTPPASPTRTSQQRQQTTPRGTPQASPTRTSQNRSADWGSPLLGQGSAPRRIQYPPSPQGAPEMQQGSGEGGPYICEQRSNTDQQGQEQDAQFQEAQNAQKAAGGGPCACDNQSKRNVSPTGSRTSQGKKNVSPTGSRTTQMVYGPMPASSRTPQRPSQAQKPASPVGSRTSQSQRAQSRPQGSPRTPPSRPGESPAWGSALLPGPPNQRVNYSPTAFEKAGIVLPDGPPMTDSELMNYDSRLLEVSNIPGLKEALAQEKSCACPGGKKQKKPKSQQQMPQEPIDQGPYSPAAYNPFSPPPRGSQGAPPPDKRGSGQRVSQQQPPKRRTSSQTPQKRLPDPPSDWESPATTQGEEDIQCDCGEGADGSNPPCWCDNDNVPAAQPSQSGQRLPKTKSKLTDGSGVRPNSQQQIQTEYNQQDKGIRVAPSLKSKGTDNDDKNETGDANPWLQRPSSPVQYDSKMSWKSLPSQGDFCTPETCDPEANLIYELLSKDIECIDPDDVLKLVTKENEDIDTFRLGNLYVPFNPGNFLPKQKLQQLRINAETMNMLYKTVFNPAPSADEAQYEPTPEFMVSVMQSLEAKVEPTIDPTTQFNSLFSGSGCGGEKTEMISLSPIAPGYFQDIVIPMSKLPQMQLVMISEEFRVACIQMKKDERDNPDDVPQDNLFKEKHPELELSVDLLKTEFAADDPPWGEEDLTEAVNIIGGVPLSVIGADDVNELGDDDAKKTAMQKGIEFFLEIKTPCFGSKVQIRGTYPPNWAPAFMYAMPNQDEVIQIAKSPSEVFNKTWKLSHPKYFEDQSLIIL